MHPVLLFGLVGLGAYLLFSSKPAAAAAPALPPGMVPRATPLPPQDLPPMPAVTPSGASSPPYTYDPTTDPGPAIPTGGVVMDPNLGGTPDMSSQFPGLAPWQSVTSSGPLPPLPPTFGYNWLTGRTY